jgi:hypothetical protein
VRLRREIRIVAIALDRVLGDRGGERSALAVDDGDANALRSEVYARDCGHEFARLTCAGERPSRLVDVLGCRPGGSAVAVV